MIKHSLNCFFFILEKIAAKSFKVFISVLMSCSMILSDLPTVYAADTPYAENASETVQDDSSIVQDGAENEDLPDPQDNAVEPEDTENSGMIEETPENTETEEDEDDPDPFDKTDLERVHDKKVVVKYLFVDDEKVPENATIDSVMTSEDRDDIVIFQMEDQNAEVFRRADGMYFTAANIPYKNGIASGRVMDYEFANGNMDGDVISEGVDFDTETNTAVFDEKALKKGEDDYANLLVQVMVPMSFREGSESSIKMQINNDDPDIVLSPKVQETVRTSPFFMVEVPLVDKGSIDALGRSELKVYLNGNDEPLLDDLYWVDPQSGMLNIGVNAALVHKITVDIGPSSTRQSEQTEEGSSVLEDIAKFFGAEEAGAANIAGPDKVRNLVVYLRDGTDPKAFRVGRTVRVNAIVGTPPKVFLAFPINAATLEGAGKVVTDRPPHDTAPIAAWVGLPKNAFGVDFTFYDDKGGGYWTTGDWKNYNPGIHAFCTHVRAPYSPQRKMAGQLKVLDVKESGQYTEAVIGYLSNVGFVGTTPGSPISQALGFCFTVRFKARGRIRVQKTSTVAGSTSVYDLNGAQYGLYSSKGDAENNRNRKGLFTTGSNGLSNEIGNLAPGTYYVRELRAPTGYVKNDKVSPVYVSAGQVATAKVSDAPQVYARIQKRSAEPGVSDGNSRYSLAGAVYSIYADQECRSLVTSLTTGAQGMTPTVRLAPGKTYWIKETTAPKGFALDTAVHSVTPKSGQLLTWTFKDVPKRGNIELLATKEDAATGEPLAGAQFLVSFWPQKLSRSSNPQKVLSGGEGGTGWDEDHLSYTRDGVLATGLTTIDGRTYYFDPETGARQTGLVRSGGKTYIFDEKDGHMLTGTVVYNGVPYSISSDGNATVKTDKTGIKYRAHVQSIGWQGYVYNGGTAGTLGKKKRVEAFDIQLSSPVVPGAVEYRAHVQSIGWQNWVKNGAMAGTSGQGKRVESFQIRLSGDIAKIYDIEYRAHVQNIGWQKWVKNGATAGTTGQGLRVEAMEIRLAKKKAPASAGTAGSSAPARQWILVSDEEGRIILDDDHKISGDDFFEDAAGEPFLPLGTVIFREIQAPQGYEQPLKAEQAVNGTEDVRSAYNNSFYVYPIDEGTESSKNVRVFDPPVVDNNPQGPPVDIFIRKRSARPLISLDNDAYSLAGAEYTLYNDSACRIPAGVVKIDKTGEGSSLKLQPGTYYVKETKVPKGFSADGSVHKIKLTKDNDTFEFTDTPKMSRTSLLVRKVSEETNEPLEGAYFTVRWYKGSYEDGKDPAETGATADKTWILRSGKDGVVSMDEDHKVFGDAFYTDSQGQAVIPIGTLTVQETKAPSGYDADDKVYVQTIHDSPDSSSPWLEDVKGRTVKNSPAVIETKIIKESTNSRITLNNSNYSLEGAEFAIYHTEADAKNSADPVMKVRTNELGETEALPLDPGIYYIRETQAPKGYLLNKEILKAEVIENQTCIFRMADEPVFTQIGLVLEKTDTIKKEPVEGAEYRFDFYQQILSEDTDPEEIDEKPIRSWVFRTDETGGIRMDAEHLVREQSDPLYTDGHGNPALPLGTIIVRESKAPAGFEMNEDIFIRSIRTDGNGDIKAPDIIRTEDTAKPGELYLRKVSREPDISSGNPNYSLAGAEYTVYSDISLKTVVGTLKTNRKGVSNKIKVAEAGIYYVRETKAPSGFETDPGLYSVYVGRSGTTAVNAEDSPMVLPLGGPMIYKTDADSGRPIPNVEFTVKFFSGRHPEDMDPEEDGYLPDRTWIFLTDKDGYIYFDEEHLSPNNDDALFTDHDGDPVLPIGTITYEETDAPEPYIVPATVYVHNITGGMEALTTQNITNGTKTGSLYIRKVSADPGVSENADAYSLEGAEFGIYSDESCEEKYRVETLTTNADGFTDEVELYLGDYYVKELKAPRGFKINTKAEKITLVEGDLQMVTIEDTPESGRAKLIKKSASPEISDNSSAYSLKDAVYGVYRDADCTDFAGTWTTGEKGETEAIDLPVGTYYVAELTAPKGFALDENVHKISVEAGETTVFETSDEILTGEFVLEKDSASPEITYGNPDYSLEGAEYGVFSSRECGAGDRLYTLTTNSIGISNTIHLPMGEYFVKETKAPKGFVIDPTVYPVSIQATPDLPEIETVSPEEYLYVEPNIIEKTVLQVKEDVGRSGIRITKKSASPEISAGSSAYSLEGAVFGIYTDPGCKALVQEISTDADGRADTVSLNYGTYYIKEVKAPKGFDLSQEIKKVVLDPKDGQTIHSIEFTDQIIQGRLRIFKDTVDEKTRQNPLYTLEGAEFTVYADSECRNAVKTLKTDKEGRTEIFTLPLGSYYVKETKAPKGYHADDRTFKLDSLAQGAVNTLTIKDRPEAGRVQIRKKSASPETTSDGTYYTLGGAVYGLYADEACTDLLQKFTTKNDGMSDILEVSFGTYYIREIKAPAGFTLSSEIRKVVLDSSETSIIEFIDQYQKGKLIIEKRSADPGVTTGNDSYSLKNAVYEIFKDKECTIKVSQLITDEKGNTEAATLPLGKYYVKEKLAPKGFALDETIHEFSIIEEGQTKTLALKDKIERAGVSIRKKSADPAVSADTEHYSLRGAEYTVYKDEGLTKPVGKLITDEHGNTEVLPLDIGTYYVRETSAPEGFELDKKIYTVDLASGHTETIESTDTPKLGRIALRKASSMPSITEGNEKFSLEGAVYSVYRDSSCQEEIAEMVTNAAGEASVQLPYGEYFVKEKKAPKGYMLDPEIHPIRSSENLSILNVRDDIKIGAIRLIKHSDHPEITDGNPNYSLSGAVYGIYLDEECSKLYKQITTLDDGSSDAVPVNLGTYWIKEISAPKGFRKNAGAQKVTVGSDTTVTVEDTDIYLEGQMRLVKASSVPEFTGSRPQYSLEGAVYEIFDDPACGADHLVERFTTNSAGISNTVSLPYGNYYVKEKSAPRGFALDDTVYTFTSSALSYSRTLFDTPKTGKGKILKTSANPNATEANPDHYSLEGAEFSIFSDSRLMHHVGTLTTGSDGASKELTLNVGVYYVVETKAPRGFERSPEAKELVILDGQTVSLSFEDMPKTGKAWLSKKASDPELLKSDDYSLEGAEYGIYADEGCSKLVDILKTKKDGSTGEVAVPLGTYYVKEIKASKGFELDAKIKKVDIVPDQTANIESIETPQKGSAMLKKASSMPTLTAASDLYSLEGARYGVFKKESCIDADKVGEFTTDRDGTSNTLHLPIGTYFVKELEAPKGFHLDTTVHSVKLAAGETSILNVEDVPGTGKVRIRKTSASKDISEHNSLYDLSGAVYTIYADKDLKNRVDTLTTDERGNTEIKEIQVGKYYLKETECPDSFELDRKVYEIDVTADDTIVVDVKEHPEANPVDMLLYKVDKDTGKASTLLAGAEFTFRFYGAAFDKEPDDNSTLLRSWIMKTDSSGQIRLDREHFVSGDDFFVDAENRNVLPYGTILVQETKSPDGYIGDDTVYVIHNFEDEPYQAPTIREESIHFNITKVETGTAITIPNAEFEHTMPDGTVETLKTGADGKLTIRNPKPGLHVFKETKAPEGYVINPEPVEILVDKDGKFFDYDKTFFKVHFDANGGDAVSETLSKKYGEKLGELPKAVRKDHNFLGWYTMPEGGAKVSADTEMPGEDMTVYAHWEMSTARQIIRYRLQEADGTYGPYITALDSSVKIGDTISWSTADIAGFDSEIYEPASIDAYTVNQDKETTIDIRRKTAEIDINGSLDGDEHDTTSGFGTFDIYINGKQAGNDITEYKKALLAGSTYEIKDIKGTGQHTFTGVAAGNDHGTTGSSDMKIVLGFRTNVLKATFDKNDGSGQKKEEAIKYGSTVLEHAPAVSRKGYTFLGWYTDASGGTRLTASSTMGEEDTTYYAQWEANAYRITLDSASASDDGSPYPYIYYQYDTAEMIGGHEVHYYADEDRTEPLRDGDCITIPSKNGYIFHGYYTSSDGKGTKCISADGQIINDLYKNSDKDMTLHAFWTPEDYTAVLDLEGGSQTEWDADSRSFTVSSDTFTLPVSPKKKGYVFKGWTGSNGNTPQINVSIPKGSTGDKHFKANWETVPYSITYDLQDGSASGNPDSYTVETDTITLNAPVKKGYTFKGWTGSNGNTPQINVSIPKGSTGDRSYTAEWRRNALFIQYNSNGGEWGGSTDSDVDYDGAYATFGGDRREKVGTYGGTLPAGGLADHNDPDHINFIRKGYKAKTGAEWSTTTSGTAGTTFSQSEIYDVADLADLSDGDKTITLYVNWEAINYPIILDANGGTNDSANPSSYTVNDADILIKAPSRRGYTFKGWTTSPDGDDYEISVKIPSGSTGEVRYYAHWEANTYRTRIHVIGPDDQEHPDGSVATFSVSYDGGTTWKKGQAGGEDIDLPYGTRILIKDLAAAQDHLDIEAASVSGADKNTASGCYEYTVDAVDADINIRVPYKKYEISYNGNGGSGSAPSGTPEQISYHSSYTPKENTYIRTGYTFKEWNTKADGSGDAWVPGTAQVFTGNADTTLYAVWNLNDYTITFHKNVPAADEDKTTVPDDIRYNIESPDIRLGSARRVGYIFTGWTGSNGTEKQTDVVVPSGSVGDRSYSANWKIKTNTARFDGNGGSDGADKTINYGAPMGVLPDSHRTGYDFDGWYTSKTDGSKISESTVMPGTDSNTNDTVTYYAHWVPHQYKITVNPNGGQYNGTSENTGITANFDQIVNIPNPVREGYTFTGWSITGMDGCTHTYGSETSTATSLNGVKADTFKNLHSADGGSVAMLANWQINQYQLTVSGRLDGSKQNDISGYGSFDVYVGGVRVADDVSTYAGSVKYGTSYEIKDIKADPGREYKGVADKNGAGSMPASDVDVELVYDSMMFNVHLDTNTRTALGTESEFVSDPAGYPNPTITKRMGAPLGDLPAPTRPNFTFTGWYTARNGGEKITGETKMPYTDKASKTTTYYAHWTGNPSQQTLKVSYENIDGTFTDPDDDIIYDHKAFEYDDVVSYTRAEDSTYTAIEYAHIVAENEHEEILKVMRQKYRPIFDSGDGTITNDPLPEDGLRAGSEIGALPTAEKAGYDLEGWYSDPEDPSTKLRPTDVVSNTTYHAKWIPHAYTITYDLGGGKADGNPSSYTIETDTFSLKEPTRAGYTFEGWTGSNGDTPQMEVSIPKGSEGDRSYTAHWRTNRLYIRYHVNGGTLSTISGAAYTVKSDLVAVNGATDILIGTRGSTQKVNLLNPDGGTGNLHLVKSGWSVVPDAEWNTNAEGTGKSFWDALNYDLDQFTKLAGKDITTTAGDVYIDLYANWCQPARTTFNYTGKEQVFTAPRSGWYMMQAWGAQGGKNSATRGNGGYIRGYVYLTKGQKVYINVGGKPGNSVGGYNGGGNGSQVFYNGVYSDYKNHPNNKCGGGGGATSFATASGTLASLSGRKDTVLLVAGGGGGAAQNGNQGGHGGRDTGQNGDGPTHYYKKKYYSGTGGTQTKGGYCEGGGSENVGSFGKGGFDTINWGHKDHALAVYAGGGGGGWYGGGGGEWSVNASSADPKAAGGGGGGSSYYKAGTVQQVDQIRGSRSGHGQAMIEWAREMNQSSGVSVDAYGHYGDVWHWYNEAMNGSRAGSVGNSEQLLSVRIRLQNQEYAGSIQYNAHYAQTGWQGWKENGVAAGDGSHYIQALQIRLTGEMAKHYDVQYRGNVQGVGMSDWVKNGATCGTTGESKRLESIEVKLVKK